MPKTPICFTPSDPPPPPTPHFTLRVLGSRTTLTRPHPCVPVLRLGLSGDGGGLLHEGSRPQIPLTKAMSTWSLATTPSPRSLPRGAKKRCPHSGGPLHGRAHRPPAPLPVSITLAKPCDGTRHSCNQTVSTCQRQRCGCKVVQLQLTLTSTARILSISVARPRSTGQRRASCSNHDTRELAWE